MRPLRPQMYITTAVRFSKLLTVYAENEYLLIENRPATSHDSMFPGGKGGLLIWHVDENQLMHGNAKEWYPGHISFPIDVHYTVALIQCDGLYELEKRGGKTSTTGNSGDFWNIPGKTVERSQHPQSQ